MAEAAAVHEQEQEERGEVRVLLSSLDTIWD